MKQIKKQVLLVLCVVACLFSLTACGKTTDAGSGIDPMTEESLKQQTVTLLEQMVSIPADQMTTIVEQNRKAGSEAVAAGLETYAGLEDDLGAYVSSGEGTVKDHPKWPVFPRDRRQSGCFPAFPGYRGPF